MYIVIFILVLFLLVLVHELGHFLAAKKTGMRVDEFGIGFPPRLFGLQRGETLYSLNAVPLGGFVKIFGEDGAPEDAADRTRAFSSRPLWAQATTLVAGVTMNVLFAWFLFMLAFAIGVKTTVDETTATQGAQLVVLDVVDGSPAKAAGIHPGAEILSVTNSDGHPADRLTPSVVSEFIRNYDSVTVRYREDGKTASATLSPKAGLAPDDQSRKIVGISMSLIETERQPVPQAAVSAFTYTLTSVRDVALGIWNLISRAVAFKADLSQVAGPVGMAGLVGDAASFGFTSLLMFMAFISLNLAVINILPFPALDGGRLLFVVIEAIKGSPIPARFAYGTNAIGFALLIALMVAVTYHDILRIIS